MSNVCMICGNAECDCRMHSECFSRGDTPDDFAEDRRVCEGGRGIMSDDEARWGEHRRVCRAAGAKVNGRAVAALARIEELEAAREKDHIGISMAKGYIAAGRADDAAAILETLLKGDS